MNSVLRVVLVVGVPILILVVLGFGGMAAMGAMKPEAQKAEEADRGLAIFVEPVRVEDVRLTVDSQGEVRPQREISVAAQISGRIQSVSRAFIDGGFVRRGEVLVRIEDADYRLAIVRARSQVASAEQRLIREQAESDIARRDIEELGIGDPTALALREPQLAEARAALESAKAQLRDTELALERTIIRAPFNGRVRSKDVDVGQIVAPGQSMGRIFGTSVAEVVLPLTDSDLGRLGLSLAFEETRDAQGPEVILRSDVAGKPREWSARIQRTSAAVDPRTRLVSAIAVVEDPFGEGADGDAPLAPGLFVTAEIFGRMVENVLVAPRSALRGKDEVYVANAEDEKMYIRKVSVLFSDVDGMYATAGLEPGDLAIISPLSDAFDGKRITIGNLDEATGGSSATNGSTGG